MRMCFYNQPNNPDEYGIDTPVQIATYYSQNILKLNRVCVYVFLLLSFCSSRGGNNLDLMLEFLYEFFFSNGCL